MKRLIAFALLLNAALLGVIAWQFVTDNHNASHQAYAADKDEILKHMSIVELPIDDKGGQAKTIRFSGVNVQVVNGAGKNEELNSLGNLVVGYQETRPSGNDRSGSHNLVVGEENNYSIHSGQVVGSRNTISGDYSAVSGGIQNIASGDYSTVSGGIDNTASGDVSTVSGGIDNTASGLHSTVGGGLENTASGTHNTVSGGLENTASGAASTVGGGRGNTVSFPWCTVSGGDKNTASSPFSTVSGGRGNTASKGWSTVSGGKGQTTDKIGQHIP